MTYDHFFLGLFLAIMATFATACSNKQETSKSREYLNCVYRQHYELGKAQSVAEAVCR